MIGCLIVNHFRARAELARRPQLADCAGVIVERSGRRAVVVDTLPAASGLSVGASLSEARSLEPDAVLIEADESYYRHEFERMLRALDAVSDEVEGAELGVAYVALDGAAARQDELLGLLPEQFRPRIGVAETKFPAFVAATTRRSRGMSVVPNDVAAFLAPCSIDLLPRSAASEALLDDLHRLDWDRLGTLAAQRRSDLLERFGREGERAWELANGIDERPLRPRTREEPVTERLALPEASVSLELLRAAVEMLLARAFVQPRMQGREAGSATLTCELEDAPSWSREFHFRSGVGHWRRAAEIIRQKLETEHPQAPVEAMTITLGHLSGATGQQLSLFADIRADREQRILQIERQLQARLGDAALHRMVSVAPWHPAPEQRTLQVAIDPAAQDEMRPVAGSSAVEVREGPAQEPLAIRVGSQWRAVSRIEDQWSFDLWWRPTPMQRRYYQVSGEDGRRLTLYRDEQADCWYRQSA